MRKRRSRRRKMRRRRRRRRKRTKRTGWKLYRETGNVNAEMCSTSHINDRRQFRSLNSKRLERKCRFDFPLRGLVTILCVLCFRRYVHAILYFVPALNKKYAPINACSVQFGSMQTFNLSLPLFLPSTPCHSTPVTSNLLSLKAEWNWNFLYNKTLETTTPQLSS